MALAGGSDGGRSRGCMMPPDALVFAEPPERRRAGRSKRAPYQLPRPRKLSPEQRVAILAEGRSRSLRELASEYGVSHETVRAVLRAAVRGATRP